MGIFKSLDSGFSFRLLFSNFLTPRPMERADPAIEIPPNPKSIYVHTGAPLSLAVNQVEGYYFREASLLEKDPSSSRQLAEAWVQEVLHCKERKSSGKIPVQHEFVLLKVRVTVDGRWEDMWLKMERMGEPPRDEAEAQSTKARETREAQEMQKAQETRVAPKTSKMQKAPQNRRIGLGWGSPKAASGPSLVGMPASPPESVGQHSSKGSLDSKRTSGALDQIALADEPASLMLKQVVHRTQFKPGALKYVRALQLARGVTRHYREYKLVTANCYFLAAVIIACFHRDTLESEFVETLNGPDTRGTFHGTPIFTLDRSRFENNLWPVVKGELDDLETRLSSKRAEARKEREELEALRAKSREDQRAREVAERDKELAEANSRADRQEIEAMRRQLAEFQRQAAQSQPQVDAT